MDAIIEGDLVEVNHAKAEIASSATRRMRPCGSPRNALGRTHGYTAGVPVYIQVILMGALQTHSFLT